jgi:23S rRNA pseudouridine2605 synthase
VFPVGRLDYATSGVLLATNDGAFADGLLHPRRDVPKTYVVKVQGEMQPPDLERWRSGVELDDGRTRPADVSFIRHEAGKTWFEITLREGRNQQIRRMGEATGFAVMRLARQSFAGVTVEGLRPGRWRHLTRDELVRLKKEFGVPARVPHAAPARAGAHRGEVAGPRYGGGAPGRRPYDVRGDWEGGAGRGRPPSRERDDASAPPGRGGRSRSTGSSGGIGADDESGQGYRLSRTRRRSR